MATNSAPPGSSPPLKPWERAGSASGPAPFKPPSSGSTSDVVEASGAAKPGEVVPTVNRTTTGITNTLSRPIPPRPWEQNYGNSYGGYGSSGMYGGYGGGYGGSLYGNNNNMYNSGYGGLYGGGSGMYGGGLYGGGLGRPMGGYGGMGMGMGTGMGMGMGPYGNPDDPNNQFGGPPAQPPSFWMSVLRVMSGVVHVFGNIAVLIDQNAQAFVVFMNALLQLFDRSGMLYGELARFIFRLFGIRTTPRKNIDGGGPLIDAPKANNGGNSWDNVWGDDLAKGKGQ